MSQHGYPERLSNSSKGFQEDVSSQTMEVLVETLTGTAFEITVSPSDTILDIKSKIFRVEGIPISQQHLVYNLRELEDARSLREQSISDGAKLRLVLGLRGGPVATRRLPPPEPWHDIERLLASKRYEFSAECGSGTSSGCKVTVLVYREGERVKMLRVRENENGTYSPVDSKCVSLGSSDSSSLTHLVECEGDEASASPQSELVHDNAVTMLKMMHLRHRMQHNSRNTPGKRDIQKTRSEEILSVPSLLDDPTDFGTYPIEDYDGNYRRFDYDCSFSERYTLLPPIGTRTDSEPNIPDTDESESVRVGGVVEGEERAPQLDTIAALHRTDYGGVVVGEARWRRGFGSSSQLARAGPGSLLHAASPPLSDALFSSSTSDLEHLKRNRMLPALSRHRNREHLHLSDERLELCDRHRRDTPHAAHTADTADMPRHTDTIQEKEKSPDEKKKIKIRCAFCKKRLSIATVHTCRCGREYCAPHRYAEVHGCAYDYKAGALAGLQRANPLVSAPKLPKI